MNNIIKSDYVLYNNKLKRLDIKGQVQVMTVEVNLIESENIVLDKKKNILISTSPSIITDIQKNKIKVDNFEYKLDEKIIKSIGNIQLSDNKKNIYKFSQIYIDENKKELFGTDAKAFLNDESLKSNKENKPRIFSNAISIKEMSQIL